jgi:hypothetical protein
VSIKQEELAERRSDTGHLTKLVAEQKEQLTDLKQLLESTSMQLQSSQGTLGQVGIGTSSASVLGGYISFLLSVCI